VIGIEEISIDNLTEVIDVCEKCYIFSRFDGRFDRHSLFLFIQKMFWDKNSLAICCRQSGRVVGVGLFIKVPSITNSVHEKVLEICWDADPNLSPVRKGKVMVKLLHYMLNYYKEIAETAHFSVPINNESVQRYLVKKGFVPKEIHFVKELY